ncbi:uncharacterized protein SPPG_07530 [Spizellomyces punctatus DAOM BR117]|uniref:Copper transport protein n=1 Tax=Spizellomyces punctatus (strain DAOM BR117) TaxID=645134 RepID=A0A0L0H884_SPIPD|nr:uncharacterized protein SPPG_07530 [Spizellomyces punctatus DAOM BR117]KNC97139.1 hypothetical protein SPPG_07530 [Spizellomyces punctatus DAOM BR117]|eukprot:XP_016605179.1 hypothetical protein SPPG_07530 [Spizellomyces punctatus DAOM BR117]
MDSKMWWQPYFITDLTGVQVLFKNLTISSSTSTLFFALSFTILLCWTERLTSYAYEYFTGSHQTLYRKNHAVSPWKFIICRSMIYVANIICKYLTMLVVMSFSVQLFVAVVLGMGTGQLVVEYWRQQRRGDLVASSEFEMLGNEAC